MIENPVESPDNPRPRRHGMAKLGKSIIVTGTTFAGGWPLLGWLEDTKVSHETVLFFVLIALIGNVLWVCSFPEEGRAGKASSRQ